MTKEEYQEYLQSDHWLKTREERKKIDNYCCALCGSSENINVHHLSYDRVGEEIVELDLITLCNRCHFMLHDAIDKAKPKVEKCCQEFKDNLWKYVEQNQDMKAIYCKYEEQRGDIYAEAAAPFCDIIKPDKTNKLFSIINDACTTPLHKLVIQSRLNEAIRKNSRVKYAYAVGCSKFSAIRRQRRRF